jgi:transcriptional antiterminator
MVALSTEERDLLRYLLASSAPVASADLGRRMNLTARQVRYRLRTVETWLGQQDATINRIPGVGLQVQCGHDQRAELLHELDSETGLQLVLTPGQRQQLLTLVLLNASEPLIIYHLELGIQVSRTTVLKDLDCAEQWLHGFGLALMRRPNYGILVEGSELARRQALAALLWGLVPSGEPLTAVTIDQGIAFRLSDDAALLPLVEHANRLLDRLDLQPALEWVAYAEAELGGRFTDDEVLHLALAFSIQAQRVRAGKRVECQVEALQWLQARPMWHVAVELSERIWPGVQADSLTDEIANLAMHLLGGPRSTSWPGDPEIEEPFDKLIAALMEEAARAFRAPRLVQDASLRDGLAAHIIPACMRQRFGMWCPSSLPNGARAELGTWAVERAVAEELASEVSARTGFVLPDDEIGNLTLLLRAAFVRERPDRPKRVIVACPSGMATAQLIVARLKARFPNLDILGVVSLRELVPERIAPAQLVISTVPLPTPAPGVDVIQVHPMLLPEDIEAITHWLA